MLHVYTTILYFDNHIYITIYTHAGTCMQYMYSAGILVQIVYTCDHKCRISKDNSARICNLQDVMNIN